MKKYTRPNTRWLSVDAETLADGLGMNSETGNGQQLGKQATMDDETPDATVRPRNVWDAD